MTDREAAPGQRSARLAPWLQAGQLAYLALYAVALLMAVAWAVSNVRQIAPGNRAVVLRFGALDRVQDSGLLLAWPRPFEQVIYVPSPEHVLEWRIQTRLWNPPQADATDYAEEARDELEGSDGDEESYGDESGSLDAEEDMGQDDPSGGDNIQDLRGRDRAGTGYLLTGDGAVVQLAVSLFLHIEDPLAYVRQGDHAFAALDRLAARSAIAVCAERDLDGILVARPELVGVEGDAAGQRERLRGDLVRDLNARLAALAAEGAGVGLVVDRADVQSMLPDEATDAFEAVLTATQEAEQAVAAARNDAAKTTQAATQAATQAIESARAQADESVAAAKASTAAIQRLASDPSNAGDPGLAWRLFRERIPSILARAGGVTLVQPGDDARLILQGATK